MNTTTRILMGAFFFSLGGLSLAHAHGEHHHGHGHHHRHHHHHGQHGGAS